MDIEKIISELVANLTKLYGHEIVMIDIERNTDVYPHMIRVSAVWEFCMEIEDND